MAQTVKILHLRLLYLKDRQFFRIPCVNPRLTQVDYGDFNLRAFYRDDTTCWAANIASTYTANSLDGIHFFEELTDSSGVSNVVCKLDLHVLCSREKSRYFQISYNWSAGYQRGIPLLNVDWLVSIEDRRDLRLRQKRILWKTVGRVQSSGKMQIVPSYTFLD